MKKVMSDYYVYIYWRLDINEPFYIGKGKNDRWRVLNTRTEHFKNIINKIDIVCEIYKDNLTEDEAHGIECWLIHELVFDYGYSIDIPNNRSKERGMHLVNQTWGGEGMSGTKHTEEWKKNHSGEKNSMYGVHLYGKLNGMYGKKHSEETKEKIRKKAIGRKPSEEAREKMSKSQKGKRLGKNNPMARGARNVETGEIFSTIKEAAEYYNVSPPAIRQAVIKGHKCKGFHWEYIDILDEEEE